MVRAATALVGVVVAVCSLGTLGCGPSLQGIQQSRVYFERCYAADFNPRIPLAEKHACWSSWVQHYTIGQPHDRVRYASDRIYAIEHGESVPHLPGLPSVAIGPRSGAPITATSEAIDVEAPPRSPSRRPPRARRPPPVPRTSNAHCASAACEPTWRSCVDGCVRGDNPCETACEVELQACARGCF